MVNKKKEKSNSFFGFFKNIKGIFSNKKNSDEKVTSLTKNEINLKENKKEEEKNEEKQNNQIKIEINKEEDFLRRIISN